MTERRPRSPLLRWVKESGPDDRVFNICLVLGPFVIALVAVFGRTLATTVLVAGYVVGFVAYTVYNGLRTEERLEWVQHP